MTNEELLIKIREDRPNQVIHEVKGYEETTNGYLNVHVDMQVKFFETIVRHTRQTIPYPLSAYNAWLFSTGKPSDYE